MTSHSTSLPSPTLAARAPSGHPVSGFFQHHGFWAPGVRLFRLVSFRIKAWVIASSFVLPTVVLGGFYFSGQAAQIAFSTKERMGVAYTQEAIKLLPVLQRQRLHATQAAATGKEPAEFAAAQGAAAQGGTLWQKLPPPVQACVHRKRSRSSRESA